MDFLSDEYKKKLSDHLSNEWGEETDDASWGILERGANNEPNPKSTEGDGVQKEPTKKGGRFFDNRRKTDIFALTTSYVYRRAFSENKLLEMFKYDLQFEKGKSYHFFTGGNIDALSYIKLIIDKFQKLDYLLFSTWCMSGEDIFQLQDWHKEGILNKIDAYVGEIFPRTYRIEWRLLNKFFDETKCGRVCCFKNHSKIFLAQIDDWFFVVETSANINTNPRTEQGCITIDKGLFDFYRENFEKIEGIEFDVI